MARPLSTAVTVDDLEYAVEHLMRLAYSSDRATKAANPNKVASALWLPTNRIELLRIAGVVEKMVNASDTQLANIVKPLEIVCNDLQALIQRCLRSDDIKRMRTAIRQKRHKASRKSEIATKYQSQKSEKEKWEKDQKALKI